VEVSCEEALQIPMAHEVSSIAGAGDRVDTTLDRCCVSRDSDQKTSTCKPREGEGTEGERENPPRKRRVLAAAA
jgi:hypothetical protein